VCPEGLRLLPRLTMVKAVRVRQSRIAPRAPVLLLGIVALGSQLSFVSPTPQRAALTRRSAGFEAGESSKPKTKEPEVKASLSREQLEADHGDKWEMVDKVLKGQRAESPEAIMRARFTGLKYKDPQFLAATEKDPSESTTIKKRAANWETTLGLKELSWWEKALAWGNPGQDSMQNAVSFEVIDSDEDEVEFKIRCGDGRVLHEKSTFDEDRKWGYVYSGESEFAEWSD